MSEKQSQSHRLLYCPNGHIIGELTGDGVVMKHQKRIISVKTEKFSNTEITIKCDKCGEKLNIWFFDGAVVKK